ncbi:FadR family transcriptional regulator [Acidisoma cellulosilytica]|uniref:FadR family transcriptional regulator n=1 Tax=Acidisoma cellulosilyticum TaxID=2802395 RepID=A0A963Z465_9PROT|nr:FadR/GntR family transcriptional regulator [Acidisoma cellulosilyticum]MCB8882294.1 FadR family transcriptional regulator [Acidisoma cellulosilyticum]
MADVPTSSRPRVHRDVVETLAHRILSGGIKPGESLPNTQNLSSALGVSRSALREAIKVLSAKGMLDVRPRTGTRVLPRSSWNLMDPELLSWSGPILDQDLVRSLLECRKFIEPGAAALAAQRATPAQLAEIEAALTQMDAESLEDRVQADLDFHVAILRASANLFLAQWGQTVSSVLLAAFRLSTGATHSYDATFSAHRDVVDAIRNRDPAAADRGMRVVLSAMAHDLHLENGESAVAPQD